MLEVKKPLLDLCKPTMLLTQQVVGIGQGAVGDFAGAIFSAPSTYLGLGSFGVGKLAAKGATKATQLGVRYGLKDYLKKNVVKTGVQRAGSQSIKKQALKKVL